MLRRSEVDACRDVCRRLAYIGRNRAWIQSAKLLARLRDPASPKPVRRRGGPICSSGSAHWTLDEATAASTARGGASAPVPETSGRPAPAQPEADSGLLPRIRFFGFSGRLLGQVLNVRFQQFLNVRFREAAERNCMDQRTKFSVAEAERVAVI